MKKSIKKIRPYIEIFLLCVIGFSPLIPQPLNAVLVVLLVGSNLKYFGAQIHSSASWFLVLSGVFFAIGVAKDLLLGEGLSGLDPLTLYYPCTFLLGYLMFKKYSAEEFMVKYSSILTVLALFSLCGVVLYIFFPDVIPSLLSYRYYHTTHKTAIFFNILIDYNGVLQRNAGFAWEPGVFQYLLNIAFLAEVLFVRKSSCSRRLIFAVAIVTTRSTVGLALLCVNVVFALWRVNSKYRRLFVAIIFCATPFILNEAAFQLTHKLIGAGFDVRYEPLMRNLEYGKNLIFGLGNTVYKRDFASIAQPAWDSLGQIFIRYGYGLTLLIASMLATGFRRYPVLALIIAGTFLSQHVWFFPLTTTLLFILSQGRKRACKT